MIDALIIGANWSWHPGFRGLLTVVVAVAILCGSVYLIMATNSGARLGFLLALTGFCGWMTVMGIIWSLYGIGWKGPAPSWKVVDVVATNPGNDKVDSNLELARTVPLPSDMPDPVELRDNSEELKEAFPPELRDPTIGDLVTADPELLDKLNEQASPWRVLETSNKYTGETQATVAEYLGPNGEAIFENGASDYIVVQSFLAGGKAPRTDDSIRARVQWKAESLANPFPDDFYAVVQLQPVIEQPTKAGQAPPTPVADPDAPVYSVVLQRVDAHKLRLNAFMVTIVMGISTALLCNMLHRRDKLAEAQRAATAGAS